MDSPGELRMFEAVSLSSPHNAKALLLRAIKDQAPFSLVRCGDGESVVLGYPGFVHERRFMTWMANFFGTHADEPGKFEPLQSHLRWAISTADVVGTFRERVRDVEASRQRALELGAKPDLTNADKVEISQIEWRLLDVLAHPLLADDALLTSTNVHIRLEESGFLRSVIENAEQVNVITGNDIVDRLQAEFPNTRIKQTRVPTEYKFETARAGWEQAEPHFPQVFERLMADIEGGKYPGITLIGAGPCGKVYASAIKKAGGIGIDVGSILDAWAGRQTRSYMQSMQPKTLVSP
jgi:hypothetical protein